MDKTNFVSKRELHYRKRIQELAGRYDEFHQPSVETLLNLFHTYFVASSYISRKLGGHVMSLSAFHLLMILNHEKTKGLPLHEISDLLLVSRANVTGLIDWLEKKGYAERVNCPEDRRVCYARITKNGCRFLEEFLPKHFKDVRECLVGLSAKEKAQLVNLLKKTRDSIQSHDAKDAKNNKKNKGR